MKVGALDLSLNATGAARLDLETGRTALATFKPGTRVGHERLQWNLEQAAEFISGCAIVVVEGLAFNSISSSRAAIDGHWALQTHMLWRKRIPYAVCPPDTLKLYATGDAKAGKADIVKTMRSAFPGIEIADDNQADAFVMATMAARWKLLPVDAHVQRWLPHMSKVHWPGPNGEPIKPPAKPKRKHKEIRL